jgi:hypothetical protein
LETFEVGSTLCFGFVKLMKSPQNMPDTEAIMSEGLNGGCVGHNDPGSV